MRYASGAVIFGAAGGIAQSGVGGQELLEVFVSDVSGQRLTGVGVVGA